MNIQKLLALGFLMGILCLVSGGQSATASDPLSTRRTGPQVDTHLVAFDTTRDTVDLQKASDRIRAIWDGQTAGMENWRLLRSEQLVAWLKLLDRVEKSIDPAFDPNAVPQINVAPPPGASEPAGVDPASIKDPKVRAEYEVLIKKNKEKAENYRFQKSLRDMKVAWTHECIIFVKNSFSDKKEDRDEVEKALQEHLSNPETRTAILAAAWPKHNQGQKEAAGMEGLDLKIADLEKAPDRIRAIWDGQTAGMENWRLLRSEQLVAWLKLLDRVEKSIDPAFDPNAVPQINVAPPPGASEPAGVDPASIKDPKVRAEYEVLIKKNKEKAENYRFQKSLRDMKVAWTHECIIFVKNSFSDKKEDRDEVEKATKEGLSNPETKTAILTAVAASTR